MDETLKNATETFTRAILDSEVYKTYRMELEKVKQFPELKQQIDEFRKRNYEFQSQQDIDFDKLDRFEKEYETFREEAMVADFLAAELDLCRTIQGIALQITDLLDFE